jgi:hypothetical protein
LLLLNANSWKAWHIVHTKFRENLSTGSIVRRRHQYKGNMVIS